MELRAPHECFSEIRFYLQRMRDRGRTTSGPDVLSRKVLDTGEMQISAGPTMFRHPCEGCVQFQSGAQLAFGITLRTVDRHATLLSFRFHLHLPPTSGLQFLRIDLNASKEDYDTLQTPRSHLHPGFENVHIPFPVLRPLEVLDRLFHVVEPAFTR